MPQQSIRLALEHHAAGRLTEAELHYRRVAVLQPQNADARHGLGLIASQMGRHEVGFEFIRQAIKIRPLEPNYHNDLGETARLLGRLPEASNAYRCALALDPSHAVAHNNLGIVLWQQLKHAVAISSFRNAINSNPAYAAAWFNLGIALHQLGDGDGAAEAYRMVIQLRPADPTVRGNLGAILKDQGLLNEALECYEQALCLQPSDLALRSSRIYTLHFCLNYDSAAILREQMAWNPNQSAASRPQGPARHQETDAVSRPRRLRIGYVSPLFYDHVVGRNILPLLREHDHTAFEIFCYSDARCPDAITERLRACADHFRDVPAMNDEQLAQQIRADQIDILVDLTLHMAYNRLAVFVQKPAPVQVTFAGYPGGTGISAIDYRLTDPYLDPPGITDADYVERSIRLPATFWCYDPQAMSTGGEPKRYGALPSLETGYVTFGCLNNFCKINEQVLSLWVEVLKTVKNSRLILLAREGSHRARTLARLSAKGVDPARIEFVPHCPRTSYLDYYRRIDIGLDTFPYNGHTTSLDALWMGVPVVTLVGSTVVGRAGLSQLTNLGMTDWVARTPEQYVEIARAAAADLPRLGRLRAALRDRMLQSPPTDARGFARGVEAAYRQMWEQSGSG